MDDRRFDDLARALAVGPATRRRALRLLGGTAAAGLLGRLGPNRTGAAQCLAPGETCNPERPGRCCSGKCSPRGKCLCTRASQCPQPGSDQSCKVAACDRGTGKCSFKNRPLDAPCPVANGTGACQQGECRVATCDSGFDDCNEDPADGCETNTQIDPTNCGQCGAPPCQQQPAISCGTTGNCVNGSCEKYGAETRCAPATCTGGNTLQPARNCDGNGSCSAPTTVDCGLYRCNDTQGQCYTSCGGNECISSAYCLSGTCRAKQGVGASCTAPNQCTSGSCVDGFCCDQACNAQCQACSAAKKGSGQDGFCGPAANGTSCNTGTCCGGTCAAGIGSSCNTGQPGRCAGGTVRCQNNQRTCVRNLDPIPELCNGVDDNCNGQVDEGFNLGQACDGSDGDVCFEGVIVCNASGTGTICSDTTPTNVEVPNGVDDDCDGQIDEGT